MHSSVTYTGDGTNQNFVVPFNYIEEDDIAVTVNGVTAPYTFLTAGTIQMTTAPANGASVKVSRVTEIDEEIVDFTDSSNLVSADLDSAYRQTFFAIQEQDDELSFWVEWIQDQTISGGDLPPVFDDNSFLISGDSTWNVLTLAETKEVLGITDVVDGASIPDPAGVSAFLVTQDGESYSLIGPTSARSLLGLGTIATTDTDELGTSITWDVMEADFDDPVSVDVASNEGKLIPMTAVGGGSYGLPALNGSLLTDIPKQKYIRYEERQAYNVHGGQYLVADVWQDRTLNSEVYDPDALATVTSGVVNLPAGTYTFRAQSKAVMDAHVLIRLVTDGGTVLGTGAAAAGGTVERWVEVSGTFTLASAAGVKIQIYSRGASASALNLGVAHDDSTLGSNVYSILELYKRPD